MGRDKGKGRGGRGSGKRMQVTNEEELALRERQIIESQEERAKRRAEENEEEGKKLTAVDEEEDEDDGSDEDGPNKTVKPNNPNFVKRTTAVSTDDPEAGLNRKQRELLEEQRKREEYMKRHLAGQTEEARRDMERLEIVRRRRAEAARLRELEGRAPGMSSHGLPSDSEESDSESDEDGEDTTRKPKPQVKPSPATASTATASAPVLSEAQAKKKAAALETTPLAGSAPAVLKAIDIKKMNGDALKEALKERGLDFQGQKKDLVKRLLDHEAARGS